MRIPTDEEILALHSKHAPTPGALDLVYTHCVIVGILAEQLCSRPGPGLDVDADLVRAGSLLHDIGVYRLYDEAGDLDHAGYIRHGVLGYELLREEGLPEAICRFASHHIGVGISRDDVLAQHLPIPPADYLAETGEERLVMYADNFHSKTTPPVFRTASACAARLRRFGEEKVRAFQAMRDTFGEPDLAALSEAYGHAVVDEPDLSAGDPTSGRRAAMLLIVTEDGGLLMHHRDDKPGIPNPGCWAGFGGAVEAGETVEEAVRREVREETGLQITDPIFLTEAVDHEGDGRAVSLFYIVGGVRLEDIDLQEGAGVAVHRVEDLPGLKITPFVRRAIYSHLLPAIA
jgi:uncharacterized protein